MVLPVMGYAIVAPLPRYAPLISPRKLITTPITDVGGFLLRHGRDVHPTWVKSLTETLSNKGSGVLSTREKSEEDFSQLLMRSG